MSLLFKINVYFYEMFLMLLLLCDSDKIIRIISISHDSIDHSNIFPLFIFKFKKNEELLLLLFFFCGVIIYYYCYLDYKNS